MTRSLSLPRMRRVLIGAALLIAPGAQAQTLSYPTLTNASSANDLDAGPNTSYERESGVQLVGSALGAFTTRYTGLVSTDNDPFLGLGPARTETLVSNYTVSFTATAPALYRLDIVTRRTGDINLRDDGGSDTDASGDVSGVSCGATGGTITGGACTLPDPGGPIGGGNSNLPFDQTNTLTVCGASNGAPVAHSLTFNWSQSSTKTSTGLLGNADEGAVRLGGTSSVPTESAADYPGTPGRTQSNDGHFVSVTITSLCGNGTVDGCGVAAEQCDEGAANGTPGSCCTATCTFVTAGTTCRSAGGDCDVAETCSGAAGACPADALVAGGTPCRVGSGDACDPTETCTGTGPACPADLVSSAGTICRSGSGDLCDPAETCTGVAGQACPANSVSGAFVVCRAAAGPCDLPENCSGVAGQACPGDTKSTAVCRPAAGSCDVAESCNGVSNTCPADTLEPATTVCRPPAGACDVPEQCTGASTSCPADTGLPDTDGDTVCDAVDNCDGTPNPMQTDGDGDSTGDACDPCTNLVPTSGQKLVLMVKRNTLPAGDDGLVFKGLLANVPSTPAIDPAVNGLRVIVGDNGSAIGAILDVLIPPGLYNGTEGWKSNSSRTRFAWKKPLPGVGNVVKASISTTSKVPNGIKFSLTGKNGSFGQVLVTQLPLTGAIILDPPFAASGQCGEAFFPGPPPAPSCSINGSGTTVKCK